MRESLRDSSTDRRNGSGRGQHQYARQERERLREGRRGNRQILLLTYCITIVFLCMAGFMVYFMVAQSQSVINNPYNKRQEVLAKKITKERFCLQTERFLQRQRRMSREMIQEYIHTMTCSAILWEGR